MVSNETAFFLNTSNKKENKDFFKIARKMLYKKYIYGKNSYKKIFTNYLIFNHKCRLTLFFKESLILDNSCEYLRYFYPKEDLKNILNKILDIYCLYSKIYPNYIILSENKFLYKNIRKKQKMIDENNKDKENKKNSYNDKFNNKENELFTLSVRNEIKEFEDNSYTNKNNNIDSSSKKRINITNTKKINENWAYISNQKNNLNTNKKAKKNNNNHSNKNISYDSFWTNDTNNLSILINAINDKIIIEESKKNDNIIKKKDRDDINTTTHKLLKNKNQKGKEIKTSSKKNFKKIIYKKIDKKIIRDNSRNNNFLKAQNKKYLNNIKTTKPLASSLSNSSNINSRIIYKGKNIYNHLLTENNVDKEIKNNIHQYHSIQKDSNKKIGKNLKKIIPPITMKKKFYSKDFSCIKKNNENYLLKKMEIMNNKYNFDKYISKKSSHQKPLKKIIIDNSNKNCFYEESNKEENTQNSFYNNKKLYNTNNNFNKLRNIHFFKRYFTNNNMNKETLNHQYKYNLTENNSQTLINSRKEKEYSSSCNHNIKNKNSKNNIDNINDSNAKTIINLQISNNYYISKNKNIKNISKNKYYLKTQKTESIVFSIRDKILKREMGTEYIKKKCFSPISNNSNKRNSLIKSCDIKNDRKFSFKINENLIQKDDIKYKLIDIRKNNRKEYIQHDKNSEKNYLNNKSINKKHISNNNLIRDTSKKENKKNIKILNLKQNIRAKKKINLRKNLSPTLTHNNLYNSNIKDLSNSKNYINNNNSEFIDYYRENILKKRNSLINNNKQTRVYRLDNKENIYNLNNQKINDIKESIDNMIKSKTQYENFKPKYTNANKTKTNKDSNDLNRNYILKRFLTKNKNLSKDKNIKNNANEIAIRKYNNLSNSTINNNSHLNEYTTIRNINNSLSNSMHNITEFQTPLVSKKRLKLIKKFIYRDKGEKVGQNSNIENVSSKIVIKVNRDKFLEKVKEKMKNRTISINLNKKD